MKARKKVDMMKCNRKNSLETDRIVYFDYLRVFATFSVMILHISAQNWYTTDVNGFEWQVFNFFDSIVRWAVPVFVMISGSLFLNRNISLKKMYSRYILRMVIAFVVWSAIYAIFMDGTIASRLSAFVQGHYHMWFILMMVGIYMSVPLIKALVGSNLRIKYFSFLALIFAFLFPELFTLMNDFGSELVIKTSNVIKQDINVMNMHIVLGYVSYFILGFYLDKKELSRRWRIVIYAFGILGFVFTIVMTLIVALKIENYCTNYYGYFNINILLEAVAVFTLFKYGKYENDKLNIFIQKLLKYSFGAYLIHALVIEWLDKKVGLNTLSFNAVLAVISISIIVFVVAFMVSALLNRIPIIKKYVV